jgi:hypothetical protein
VKLFQIKMRKIWGVPEEVKCAGFYWGNLWKLGSMGKVEAHSNGKMDKK